MQDKILDEFVNAYNNAYNKKFNDDFKGKIELIKAKLNEPFLHLSWQLKQQISHINLDENIKIAIVGQFSSGKSTLLNLILNKQCLPTGIVPVTSKSIYLKYAKDYFLIVEFEDGDYKITNIEELPIYTDQRKQTIKAKNLHIYAPIDILKNITFIDTPGLNANDIDNFNTLNELNQAHFLIWLSLIDNAGKQSEIQILDKIINKKALCVLTQKDKLNNVELNNVLTHTKEVFAKYFDKIIAISCKQALDQSTYDKSNFDEFLHYLSVLDQKKLKEEFVKDKFLNIFDILNNQYIFFLDIFNDLLKILNDFCLVEFQNKIKEQIKIINNDFLKDIKELSFKFAKDIFSRLKEKEFFIYKKTFFKNNFKRYSYKAPFLEQNYNVSYKEIAKIKNKTLLNFKNLKTNLNDDYKKLEKNINDFKIKFSNIQKNDVMESEYDFAELRSFSSLSDELFLKHLKDELFRTCLELDLLFEKLSLKTFLNFDFVIKTCLLYFFQKIEKSKEFYELDSKNFSIYYPKLEEINEYILNELNFYDFEALLLQRSEISKILNNFFDNYQKILQEKKSIIKSKQDKFINRLEFMQNLRDILN